MLPNFSASRCHIDTGAIARNFRKLGSPERLMPVIKSDAYGHGLLQAAKSLDKAGALRFAVGLAQEGAALREAGFKQPITLLMGCVTDDDWRLAARHRLMPIVGTMEDLRKARAIFDNAANPQPLAIKCDSGMSRLGFTLDEIPEVIEALRASQGLDPAVAISHLACADMPEMEELTQMQERKFSAFAKSLQSAFPRLCLSLGNSASTIANFEEGILRPGLVLYGYSPFADDAECGLEPAMSVSTPVLQVRDLKAGQTVSYGATFTAPASMRIAIVACGYATGYARNLSGRAQMLLRGRRVRQIGRICMSMTMLDVTGVPEARAGDSAWIMGGPASAGAKPVNASELAAILGTIPYEILCQLGSLNPRVYTD